MGLTTTTSGWFPKPVELLRARWRFAEEEIGADELGEVTDRATADALRLQEEVGLDVLVDGQLDRGDLVSHFAERLGGVELLGLVRVFDNRYYRRPRIHGDVARDAPITVDRYKSAANATSLPLKAVLTGPYTLADWSFDEHYGSRETCCLALAAAVRDEAKDLEAAGAPEIQIDEPALGARAEDDGLAREALATITSALAGTARTWARVGFGGTLPSTEALAALPVDGLIVDATGASEDTLRTLAGLPAERRIAAGVVDPHAAAAETVDEVRARIERLLGHVDRERLTLTVAAGLGTLDVAAARTRLETLVAAAASF